MLNKLLRSLAIASAAVGVAACDDDKNTTAQADLIAVTQDSPGAQKLVQFRRQSPDSLLKSDVITGLTSADSIIGMDLRPSDNVLVVLARNSDTNEAHLYSINPSTAAATSICTLVTGAAATSVLLGPGDSYGTDFNPTALAGNALRIASSAGQNLRVDTRPATALGTNVAAAGQCATSTDGTLNTVTAGVSAPRQGVSAAAYTNSVAGAVTTTLYYIDTDEATPTATVGDRLLISTDPNSGIVGNVGGPLGFDITGVNGFEISSPDNVATLVAQIGSSSAVFNVNLVTGAATQLGTVGGDKLITALTTRPPI